jgi:hypothetical protein
MSFININKNETINNTDVIKILPAMIVKAYGVTPGLANQIYYTVGVWDNTNYFELDNIKPLDRYEGPVRIEARPIGYLIQAYKVADNIYFNFTEKLSIKECEEDEP